MSEQPTPSKDPADGSTGTAQAIASMVAAWSSNPYVGAVITVLNIIGFFSARSNEAAMVRRLQDVQDELREVNDKITEALGLIKELPSVFARELGENERLKLIGEIGSNYNIFYSILSKYHEFRLSDIREHINDRDSESLATISLDMLKLSYQFQVWGPDAFVSMGQAYAVFLSTIEATGFAPADPETVRAELIKHVERAHSTIAAAKYRLDAIEEREVAILKAVPGRLFLGGMPSGEPMQGVSEYGRLAGNLEVGFTRAGHQREGDQGLNGRGWPSLGNASGDGGVPPNFRGKGYDALGKYAKQLNERRGRLSQLKQQRDQLAPLERSSLALLLAIATRQPSIGKAPTR